MAIKTRDLLLIHGAWQGAWAWSYLIPELQKLGFRCHAVDMPGNGNGPDDTPPEKVSMELYMTFLRAELDRIGEDVVVIGHSSGGILASQLGELEPRRVKAIIYVAGMMLPSRMRFAELVEELKDEYPEVLGIVPYLDWSKDGETSTVRKGAGQKIFLQDCPPKIANAAAKNLKPHPQRGRDIFARLTKRNFGRIPRAYVEATLDQSVVQAAQRRMQELVPGARHYEIDSGHAPLVSRPVELAAMIDDAVRNL